MNDSYRAERPSMISEDLINEKAVFLFAKRGFDIVASLMGLLVLSIPMLLIAVIVKLDSPGPVIFKQKRIGKNKKPFNILKFRSMIVDAEKKGIKLTLDKDPRITRVGSFLRKSKLDELPQLINVLRGDMSFVGPRPETLTYIQMYGRYPSEIFYVRPGITDLASIEYSDEGSHFKTITQTEKIYIDEIPPHKIELKLKYIREMSVRLDLLIILKTLYKITGMK